MPIAHAFAAISNPVPKTRPKLPTRLLGPQGLKPMAIASTSNPRQPKNSSNAYFPLARPMAIASTSNPRQPKNSSNAYFPLARPMAIASTSIR